MNSVLREKSFAFAVRIVGACRHLAEQQREFILSKQLPRSGTAIGALVREAEYAETRADFIHKLAIARKEANETLYWLELLESTGLLTPQQTTSLHANTTEYGTAQNSDQLHQNCQGFAYWHPKKLVTSH